MGAGIGILLVIGFTSWAVGSAFAQVTDHQTTVLYLTQTVERSVLRDLLWSVRARISDVRNQLIDGAVFDAKVHSIGYLGETMDRTNNSSSLGIAVPVTCGP